MVSLIILKKLSKVLLVNLVIFSSVFVSAAEWKGQEYISYNFPLLDETIIDDVKQKIMERYGLSEEYFDQHLVLHSTNVFCHDPDSLYEKNSTFCMAKKENPHLLEQIEFGWFFVPDQEEYKDTDFFTNARFSVSITVFDERGLESFIEDAERSKIDMGKRIVDYENNRVYTFPLLNDILEVVKPGDLFISKKEAEEKLLQCVGSFSGTPYISLKSGILHMAAGGPFDSEGKNQVGKVDLKTGELVECFESGLAQLERTDIIGSIVNTFQKILDWVFAVLKTS